MTDGLSLMMYCFHSEHGRYSSTLCVVCSIHTCNPFRAHLTFSTILLPLVISREISSCLSLTLVNRCPWTQAQWMFRMSALGILKGRSFWWEITVAQQWSFCCVNNTAAFFTRNILLFQLVQHSRSPLFYLLTFFLLMLLCWKVWLIIINKHIHLSTMVIVVRILFLCVVSVTLETLFLKTQQSFCFTM